MTGIWRGTGTISTPMGTVSPLTLLDFVGCGTAEPTGLEGIHPSSLVRVQLGIIGTGR